MILNEDIAVKSGRAWFDYESRKSKKYYGEYFVALLENVYYDGYVNFTEYYRKILHGECKAIVIKELEELIKDLSTLKELIEQQEV